MTQTDRDMREAVASPMSHALASVFYGAKYLAKRNFHRKHDGPTFGKGSRAYQREREKYGNRTAWEAVRTAVIAELIDHAIANVPPLTIDPHGGTLRNYVVGYLDARKESE